MRPRLSYRNPSRFIPVSILRWQRRRTPRAAAAASSAHAAAGDETAGVRPCSNTPPRSLTLIAPKTRIGIVTPARRRSTPSSMSAQASIEAPAASSVRPTRSAPCPYALALTTAMTPGTEVPASAV